MLSFLKYFKYLVWPLAHCRIALVIGRGKKEGKEREWREERRGNGKGGRKGGGVGREGGRKRRHLKVEVFSWNTLKKQPGKLHNSLSSHPLPGPERSIHRQYEYRDEVIISLVPYVGHLWRLLTSAIAAGPSRRRNESSPFPLLHWISCLQVALRPILWEPAGMCFVS